MKNLKQRRRLRAIRRSQQATASRSKLQRKADRVVESERERELRAALGVIRGERDAQLFGANRDYDKMLKDARSAHAEARHKIEVAFEEKRATILKAFARDGVEVDAA